MSNNFFTAELKSIWPSVIENDQVITLKDLKEDWKDTEALIIRTLPNGTNKLKQQYSNTNPPYLQQEAADFLRQKGVQHLLIDLPSIDKEVDGVCVLAAHHAFWGHPKKHTPDL